MPNVLTYGFVNLQHLAAERVSTVGVDIVRRAVQESVAEHTANVNALLSAMVQRTTDHQIQFRLPGTGTLQPLDQDGIPTPVVEQGHYTVAFPIQGGGTAWGTNRVTRELMTVEEANEYTLESIKRDSDWMRRHVLAAVFDNVSWNYTDEQYGVLAVQPLANGDAVTYVRAGTGLAATDDHYLAQAAGIADASNPFPTIYRELMEHPSNAGPVVVYAPTNLVDSIVGLTSFVPVADPDIRIGVATDTLAGQLSLGLGDEVLGKVDKCWVVEWRSLPDNYMIAHAQGAGAFVAQREYPVAALQGLFVEDHSPDGARLEMRMIRYAGFGVINRVAALAYRIGNAAYAIPAGFDAPLAV
jgi:hypothetical protein